eukprot:scaffold82952_cov39-Phaeocystis_antarctica.AAC.2
MHARFLLWPQHYLSMLRPGGTASSLSCVSSEHSLITAVQATRKQSVGLTQCENDNIAEDGT